MDDNYFAILWWFCHTSTWISHEVYMCLPILTPLPPPSPPYPSGVSQNTGFGCPASCIKLALVTYFTSGNIYVSVLFSQIIPPLPSPTESKKVFPVNLFYLLFLGDKIYWQRTEAISPMLCSPGPRGRSCFQLCRLIVFYQQDSTKAPNKARMNRLDPGQGAKDAKGHCFLCFDLSLCFCTNPWERKDTCPDLFLCLFQQCLVFGRDASQLDF